jgi:hypothetical protein
MAAMRIFYLFWFFFCGVWGYLLPLAAAENEKSILDALVSFPVALIIFGLMAFFAMKSAKIGASDAHISLDIKPWKRPLGTFVFVPISIIFISAWGVCFSVFRHKKGLVGTIEVLAFASGLLLGTWLACRVYRNKYGFNL